MPRKKIYSLTVLFTIFVVVISACAPPAPTSTQAPEATESSEATQAPVATEAQATSAAEGTGACPAITMADTQGVAPGAWPQQYEVAEFEAAANCTLTFTGPTEFDERLVETGHLPEGDPPPV